jgi:hypothetical protein
MGAVAAKKYMNQQQARRPYSPDAQSTVVGADQSTMGAQGSTSNPELLDADGRPVHGRTAGQGSPLDALRSNPNLAWIADPELRARNLQRVRDLWAQRHQR